MSEQSDFIESFQDYFEVNDIVKQPDETIIKVSLPYSNQTHTVTDTMDARITINKELEVPECLKDIQSLSIEKKKLSKKCSLLDCVDSLYLQLEERTNRSSRVKVRDFCFPSHDPRHFGHYPSPSPNTVWTECTMQQDYSCKDGLFRKHDQMLIRKPDIIIQDGLFVCRRADDHLPNNHFSIPNHYFRGKE